MAKRMTMEVYGSTNEEKAYIASFLEANKPDGYELLGGSTLTIYAANAYMPEFQDVLKKMHKDMRDKALDYILIAEDIGYDRYEVSKEGLYLVGGYPVVGLDPDGCGPIKEYVAYDVKEKVA